MNDSDGPLDWEIDCERVKAKIDAGDDFVLLDCREQDEYDRVHIDRAQHLPMSQMMQRSDELEPWRNRQLIVHCHHGMRSLQVAAWLRNQGFDQCQSMAGGIDRWALIVDQELPRY